MYKYLFFLGKLQQISQFLHFVRNKTGLSDNVLFKRSHQEDWNNVIGTSKGLRLLWVNAGRCIRLDMLVAYILHAMWNNHAKCAYNLTCMD